MLLHQLQRVLSGFRGCTFASLDAETKEGGLIRRVTNERVMLFTNSRSSGYENLVKRRLQAEGKNPDLFVSGDLAWGERLADSPIIAHRGFYYLQTILMSKGEEKYFMPTGNEVPPHLVSAFVGKRSSNQGLSDEKAVIVHCYALENIKAIRLLGEELPAKPRRKILGITGRKK